jgi:hypothetical protein
LAKTNVPGTKYFYLFFSLLFVKANLESSGQKSGNIFEGDDRDVEGVAEPDEPSALDGSVDVQATYNRIISKINFLRSTNLDCVSTNLDCVSTNLENLDKNLDASKSRLKNLDFKNLDREKKKVDLDR